MQEFYEELGLTQDATDEEITARYNQLKEKYSEERWQDGEAGNRAAKKLTKIQTAYQEIMSARKETKAEGEKITSLEEVAKLLKEGDVSKAQSILDDCNERNAEWHYLQAVIFYKKNWTNDSKKQLEIAMQMDPANQKYRSAYKKMNEKDAYEKQNAGATQNPYQNQPNGSDNQMGAGGCNDCASCCYTFCCVNCLFNCCCGCR